MLSVQRLKWGEAEFAMETAHELPHQVPSQALKRLQETNWLGGRPFNARNKKMIKRMLLASAVIVSGLFVASGSAEAHGPRYGRGVQFSHRPVYVAPVHRRPVYVAPHVNSFRPGFGTPIYRSYRPGVSIGIGGHPGFGHPGFGYPGFGHPGFGHPGFGYSGFGHPGFGRSSGFSLYIGR